MKFNDTAQFARWLMLMLLAGTSLSVASQTINVTTDAYNTSSDGECSLFEALLNVDVGGQDFPDCEPGSSLSPPAPVDILIPVGLGPIEFTDRIVMENPFRLIGPSSDNKAVLRLSPSNPLGMFVLQPSSEFTRDFQFINLRIEDVIKNRTVGGGTPCNGSGSAICAEFSLPFHTLLISDVEFLRNRNNSSGIANPAGGAVAVLGVDLGGGSPSVRIERSLFSLNEVPSGPGGGLHVAGADLSISDSRFESNIAIEGGAVSTAFSDTVTITSSTFSSNQIEFAAPATENRRTSAAALTIGSVRSLLFSNNWLSQNAALEGLSSSLIPNRGRTVTVSGAGDMMGSPSAFALISNSYIGDNSAAGLYLQDITATITSTSLHQNRFIAADLNFSIPRQGAGLSALRSDVNISNSTIVGNVSPSSGIDEFGVGGIHVIDSTLNLEHVTIAENDTLGPPRIGGLRADNSTVSLSGTLLADNFGATNGNVGLFGSSTLNVFSSQFGDDAFEINGMNSANEFSNVAGLDAVQDMGCTVRAGASNNPRCVPIAPLGAGAVALNRSDPTTSLQNDQRGADFTRQFGPGNLPDIGAHELQPPIVEVSLGTVVALNEGDSGLTTFPFILTRNGDKRASTTANWMISGFGVDPADASDFSAASWAGGSVVFGVDVAEAQVIIEVVGDTTAEASEEFRLALGVVTNGAPGDITGRSGTIINDDSIFSNPIVSLRPVAINLKEGDFLIGSQQIFQAVRSDTVSGFCSFQVELSSVGPNGISDDDFVNRDIGTVTVVMAPKEVTRDIVLQVAGDAEFEGDESYRLSLINPTGCFVDNTAGSVDAFIADDESLISVEALSGSSVTEGNSGSSEVIFRIRRSGFLGDIDGVNWSIVGSGFNPANADDFVGALLPSGGVGFLPNVESVDRSIRIAGDLIAEMDEEFTIQLTDPNGGELGTAAIQITVLNDDSQQDLVFSDRFQ
ncbi:MAG: Calx-beta domain-containing protein [Pseudomonadota bacterium]